MNKELRKRRRKKKKKKTHCLVVKSTSKSTADTMQSTENPGKVKLAKIKNPRGKKTKQEIEVVQEAEAEEDKEVDETMTKWKIVGYINKEKVAAFQEYVCNKMIILVEKMRKDKNIIQSMRELIRTLKLEYNNLGLFKNNEATDIGEIVLTIPETRGTAWPKYLEGKEILDAEDYNMIVKATVRSHLFQEGHLHEKIDQNVLGPETEDTKEEIMARCTSHFDKVAKAHGGSPGFKGTLDVDQRPGSLFKNCPSSHSAISGLLYISH